MYRNAQKQLDTNVRAARANLSWYREALQQVEAHQNTPGIPTQRHWLRARRAEIAQAIVLPPLLTLTALEKLYELWNEDLDADPDTFLFSTIFAGKGAYIGSGDTTRIHAEWRQQRGPTSAYPKDFQGMRVLTKATIYNERAISPQAYDKSNRRRYAGVFTANTSSVPFKVLRYRLVDGPFIDLSRNQETHETAFEIKTLPHLGKDEGVVEAYKRTPILEP